MGGAPSWTKEDLNSLQEMWGKRSIPYIAKKLGRTVTAVKVMAARQKLGDSRTAGDLVSFCGLLEAIGQRKNYTYLKMRLLRDGFPAKMRRVDKSYILMVDIDEFWEWAERNKDALDFSDFEEYALGKEPDWAKEKRKADVNGRFITKPWTKTEDSRLSKLLKMHKYTYDDLSREFNRSEGAIKKRINDLNLKEWPVRRDNRFWTEEEIKKLLEMKISGYCYEDIGKKLSRSGSAVRGKYERLQNPDYHKRYFRRQRENMSRFFQKEQCKHYVKTIGCAIDGDNCDECLQFSRRSAGEKVLTGWNSCSSNAAVGLLENRRVECGAENVK